MKKILTIATALCIVMQANAQIDFGGLKDQATTIYNTTTGNNGGTNLSNDQIIKGLKEALNVGSKNATASASKLDGFYKNPKIKIPFPKDAQRIKTTVENLGMKPQVDKFVMTLNRAAEEAAKEAAPIFLNAVTTMTISDGLGILNGGDNAATNYLSGRTTPQLKAKFQPVVKKAIAKVHLTKYWNPIISKYNKVPFVQKMNPDLEAYVTEKAIEGMFKLIADEEMKIRKDPAARVNDILQQVFGGQ